MRREERVRESGEREGSRKGREREIGGMERKQILSQISQYTWEFIGKSKQGSNVIYITHCTCSTLIIIS